MLRHRAVVLLKRNPPVSVRSATYRERAIVGVISRPRHVAKSKISSPVAHAVVSATRSVLGGSSLGRWWSITSFGIFNFRTASARTPSRFTSEMSSTISTSDSASALAPRLLASRTSSPRRNLYISGHGVGFTTRDLTPIWPSSRDRAVSEPQPSPSALMWVDIATERPARSSRARRSIDSRRCWGTLRRSSTAFRAGQLRMRSAVEEVDHEPDDHPDDEPLPRRPRQTRHHVATDQNSEDWNDRHEGSAERTRQVWRLVAKHDDAR